MKRALICGVTGQDGAYLSALLLEKGYEVFGTSRNATNASFGNLRYLAIQDRVKKITMAPTSLASVTAAIVESRPDEIYNLSAQSSVGASYERPAETVESIVSATLCLLEGMRTSERPIRLYSAGSSECFGDTGDASASEDTPFRPRSPYGVAKASAYYLVATYREAYGIPVCTGITFNHESPLRPERFVTQKIVRGAARIAREATGRLSLETLDTCRDWGWAPEYVEVMWLMLQRPHPSDYVIATGRSVPLRHFVERAFAYFGLNWEDHVDIDGRRQRPWDIPISRADPSRAALDLGWRSSVDVEFVIRKMCAAASSSLDPDA